MFLRGGIRGRAQFAHTTRRDAIPDVTKTYCAKKTKQKDWEHNGPDQTQQISVLIGYIHIRTHTSRVSETEHF